MLNVNSCLLHFIEPSRHFSTGSSRVFFAISIQDEPLHNYDISRSAIDWTNESMSQSSTRSQLSLPTRSFFKSCVATAVNNSWASRLSMFPRPTFSGHSRWRPQLIHPMRTSTANSTRLQQQNQSMLVVFLTWSTLLVRSKQTCHEIDGAILVFFQIFGNFRNGVGSILTSPNGGVAWCLNDTSYHVSNKRQKQWPDEILSLFQRNLFYES